MLITQENLDTYTLRVNVSLEPDDYNEVFGLAIKKHRKNIALPGFRQGQVPVHLIRQRFGKTIFFEELRDNSFELVRKYVSDKDYKIYGYPILIGSNHEQFEPAKEDFEAQLTFVLALEPEVEIKPEAIEPVERLEPQINEQDFLNFIDNARVQLGKTEEVTEFGADKPRAYRVHGKIIAKFTIEDIQNEPEINIQGFEEGKEYTLERPVQVYAQNEAPNYDFFLDKKVGDVVSRDLKEMFGEEATENLIRKNLQLASFEYKIFSRAPFDFEIEKIEVIDPAPLTREFLINLIQNLDAAELPAEEKQRPLQELDVIARNKFANMYQQRMTSLFYIRLRDALLNSHPIKMPINYLHHWFFANNQDKKFNSKFEYDNAWASTVISSTELFLIQTFANRNPQLKVTEEVFEKEMQNRFMQFLVTMEKNIIIGTPSQDPEEYRAQLERVKISDKRIRELSYEARQYVREEIKKLQKENRYENEMLNMQKEVVYNYLIANFIVVDQKKVNIADFDATYFKVF